MKDRPIIFSTPMVQAILGGNKSQTRRIVNFKKIAKRSGCTNGTLAYSDTFKSWAVFDGNGDADLCLVNCPYGEIGDRLWVREPFSVYRHPVFPVVHYKADDPTDRSLKYKPSIHMFRWQSRITLQITNIRVARLQDISGDDCISEGIDRFASAFRNYSEESAWITSPKHSYKSLWNKINGADSWDLNPFVWVIEFKRVDK